MTDPMAEWREHQATIQARLRATIASLRIDMAAMRAIRSKANADIGPGDTKDIARAMISVDRAMIDIIRAILNDYGDVSTDQIDMLLADVVGMADRTAHDRLLLEGVVVTEVVDVAPGTGPFAAPSDVIDLSDDIWFDSSIWIKDDMSITPSVWCDTPEMSWPAWPPLPKQYMLSITDGMATGDDIG